MSKPAPDPADRVQRIPLGAIEPSPFNPRTHFDPAALAELAESVRARGVLDPVLVRVHPTRPALDPKGNALPPCYELIGGERRTRAARAAGLSEVPARVVPWTDREVRDYQLLEFDQRRDLSPSERAAAYQREVDGGRAVEDLARAVGRSPWQVRRVLRLARLSAEARALVDAGWLPRTTAELVGGLAGETARRRAELCVLQGVLAPDLVRPKGPRAREPLTFRQTQDLVRTHFTADLRAAPFSTKDPLLVPHAGTCEACPKRAGNAKRDDPDLEGAPDHMCLDPECFRAKADAFRKREEARAKSGGRPVLPKAQAAGLFDRYGVLKAGGPYVDLAATGEGTKARTYGEAVGPAVAGEVVIAYDGAGTRHELVPKGAAQKALREAAGTTAAPERNGHAGGHRGGGGRGGAGAAPAGKPDWQREREEGERLGRAVSAELARAAQSLFAAVLPAGDGPAAEVLRAVAGWAAQAGDLLNDWDALLARRGIGRDAHAPVESAAVAKYLAGLDAAGVLGFLVDLAASDCGPAPDRAFPKALAKALQVDRKAIEKRVRDEARAAERADGGPPADGAAAANARLKAPGKGEPIDKLGVRHQDLDDAYVGSKLGSGMKAPPRVRPVRINGRPYVVEGIHYQSHGRGTTWRCTPLWEPKAFAKRHPGVEPRLSIGGPDLYLGVRVLVGKAEWVIGGKAETRLLVEGKKKAKAKAGR